VSPNHGICYNNVFACAKNLVNGSTIYQDKTFKSIDYYHIETEQHCILMADGLCAESFLDINVSFREKNFVEYNDKMIKHAQSRVQTY